MIRAGNPCAFNGRFPLRQRRRRSHWRARRRTLRWAYGWIEGDVHACCAGRSVGDV